MRNLFAKFSNQIEWLSFFSLVLLAWLVLFLMQPGLGDAGIPRLYGVEFWASLCAPLTGQSGYFAVFSMWALMSAAMMAPTFVPTLATYLDLSHTTAANRLTTAFLLGGYFVVWLVFSAIAAAAQLWLARLGWLSPTGISINWGFTSFFLIGAGLYQFSAFKEACLSKCRAPFAFFMANWKEGSFGAAKMGAELGLTCLGCCWALMSLGFVGGVMNLIWMGIATVLMVLEKLPEIGRYVTRPLGVLLVGAGVFAGLTAIGI